MHNKLLFQIFLIFKKLLLGIILIFDKLLFKVQKQINIRNLSFVAILSCFSEWNKTFISTVISKVFSTKKIDWANASGFETFVRKDFYLNNYLMLIIPILGFAFSLFVFLTSKTKPRYLEAIFLIYFSGEIFYLLSLIIVAINGGNF